MISELLAIVVQIVTLLWPIRIVYEDERAGRYRCGHWISEKGPGWYWNVPFFMAVKEMSIAKGIKFSRRIDVTLSDGRQLACYLSATARIVDVKKAQLEMDDYDETTEEILTSVGAAKLMEVDAKRVTEHENRGRLLANLQQWVQKEAAEYGIEMSGVRFAGLVLDPPTLRLLTDGSPALAPPKKERAA